MVSLGKVSAPKPVNLPSQKKENNGNDSSVNLFSKSVTPSGGGGGWGDIQSGGHGMDGSNDAQHGDGDGHKMPPRVIPAQPSPAWGGAGLPEERKRTLELASREQFPTLGAAPSERPSETPPSGGGPGMSSWDEDERGPFAGPPHYHHRQMRRDDHHQGYQEGRGQYGHYRDQEDHPMPPRYYGGRHRGQPPRYDDEPYFEHDEERGPYPQHDRRRYDSYENGGDRFERDYNTGRYHEGRPHYAGGYYMDHQRDGRRPYQGGMNGDRYDEYASSPRRDGYGGGYREESYHGGRRYYSRYRDRPSLSPPSREQDRPPKHSDDHPESMRAPVPPPPPPRKPPPPPPVQDAEENGKSGSEDEGRAEKNVSDQVVEEHQQAQIVSETNINEKISSDNIKGLSEREENQQQRAEEGSESDVKPPPPPSTQKPRAWSESGRPLELPKIERPSKTEVTLNTQSRSPMRAPTRILKREQNGTKNDAARQSEKGGEGLDLGMTKAGLGSNSLSLDLGTEPIGRTSNSSSTILDETVTRETKSILPEKNQDVARSLLPPSLQGLSLEPMSFSSDKQMKSDGGLITGSDAVNAAFRNPDHPPGLFAVSVNNELQGPPQPLMTFGTESSSSKIQSSSLGLFIENFNSDENSSVEKKSSGPAPALQFGEFQLPDTIDGCVDPDSSAQAASLGHKKEFGKGRGYSGRRGRGRGRGDRRPGRSKVSDKADSSVSQPPPPPPPPRSKDNEKKETSNEEMNGPKSAAKSRRGRGSGRYSRHKTESTTPPATPPGLTAGISEPATTNSGGKGNSRKQRGPKPAKRKTPIKESDKDPGRKEVGNPSTEKTQRAQQKTVAQESGGGS